MAVNEKPVFAQTHTTYDGRSFQPGERMDHRLEHAPHAVKQALENGVATDSPTVAKAAKERELERRAQVAETIASRSEKRDVPQNIPNLVRLPDGNYARADY